MSVMTPVQPSTSAASPAVAPPAAPIAAPPAPFVPLAPETPADSKLDGAITESLILKYLATVGTATGANIAEAVCLPTEHVTEQLAALKQQQIVVYVGAGQVGDFTCALTDAGRDRARRFMLESMYVGPAPVTLEDYIASVAAQTITCKHPQERDLREAFSDLLITPEMFNILGPAINSGRGMFLYGYAGNGKTSIAERITKCFGDTIYIPHCIVVDGLIIKLLDAAQHVVVGENQSTSLKNRIYLGPNIDRRWVKIQRPTIVVGGELTLDALEVQYNTTSKTCEAPMQMKSNCGTLLIDDFGRQRMQPIELLNRWIVPLEKRFDFLALPNGKKIRIPFDQLIIFATNLEPKDLCDDAFLRRIPYKINVPDPTEEVFRKLFEFVAPKMGFAIDEGAREAIEHLVETHYRPLDRPFRCCQPRDLLLQVRNRCFYLGQPLRLTPDLLDYAVSVYFTIM